MKAKKEIPNPTPAELQILRALWHSPGSTVRELYDVMPKRGTGYTTVLKTLQIMIDKRLVTRSSPSAGRISTILEWRRQRFRAAWWVS